MTYEIMSLFGGSIVLMFLKRKRYHSKKRTKGFLKIFLLVIDACFLFGGLGLFMYGIVHFLR
jgi:hypothetical protein